MRMTNGAAMTGKRVLGIAAASGAAVFVLASGGMASASPLPAHHSASLPSQHHAGMASSRNHVNDSHPGKGSTQTSTPAPGGTWNRVNNQPGNGSTQTSAPIQGQPGWNRVSNTPGTTGGQGGQGGQGGLAPGSTPTPSPTLPGGAGGRGGLA